MIGDKLPFRLYPEEVSWWSENDYRTVLDVTMAFRPKRVLEFGPGSSTLALLEGGAQRVDTCENDEVWAKIYDERLVLRFPTQVYLHRYIWKEPITIPALDKEIFDLALIDGPYTTLTRPPVIEYALERCHRVLVPTEDDGRKDKSFLRPILADLASQYRAEIEFMETGPLSGGFALLTRYA